MAATASDLAAGSAHQFGDTGSRLATTASPLIEIDPGVLTEIDPSQG
jgi:hypothetical protein